MYKFHARSSTFSFQRSVPVLHPVPNISGRWCTAREVKLEAWFSHYRDSCETFSPSKIGLEKVLKAPQSPTAPFSQIFFHPVASDARYKISLIVLSSGSLPKASLCKKPIPTNGCTDIIFITRTAMATHDCIRISLMLMFIHAFFARFRIPWPNWVWCVSSHDIHQAVLALSTKVGLNMVLEGMDRWKHRWVSHFSRTHFNLLPLTAFK